MVKDVKQNNLIDMKYYRVEVNHNNIGVVLETPFSLNPTRLRFSYNPLIWNLLSTLVDISLENNFSLLSVCNAAVEQNHEIADYLSGIWEVLFERAKPKTIPLKRTECAFFFKTKSDALRFRESYPGMAQGTLCEVEIITEVYALEADMNWLDSINEKTITAEEAIDTFKKYWAGEKTETPIMEVLFLGKYKLNPIS